MKKILFVILLIIIIAAYFWLKNGFFLTPASNYTIVNVNGEKIPARLYNRNVEVKIGDKMQNVDEIVIFFDPEIEMEYNPVVLIPKYKLMGLIEGGDGGFIKLGNKVFQISQQSNKFITLDNKTFFDDPPIKSISFEENEVTFNSFEGLKKYGPTIIIKK